MKPPSSLIALLLLPASLLAQDMPSVDVVLREELIAMQAEDQRIRTQPQPSPEASDIASIDARHTARLKAIIEERGWPSRSLVGQDGAAAAFLLAQHADMDPAFQQQALALMEPLVRTGEVEAMHYAYLWDRTHAPQRFGTQGRCTGVGAWAARDIEDPEQVDSRRAAVGLPPMSGYIEMVSQFCRHKEGP